MLGLAKKKDAILGPVNVQIFLQPLQPIHRPVGRRYTSSSEYREKKLLNFTAVLLLQHCWAD
jgi:hypothetical protein